MYSWTYANRIEEKYLHGINSETHYRVLCVWRLSFGVEYRAHGGAWVPWDGYPTAKEEDGVGGTRAGRQSPLYQNARAIRCCTEGRCRRRGD